MIEYLNGEEKEYLHHHTDEIVCPYCYHIFEDSCDYGDLDHQTEIGCDECDNEFKVFGQQEYKYYTERLQE